MLDLATNNNSNVAYLHIAINVDLDSQSLNEPAALNVLNVQVK